MSLGNTYNIGDVDKKQRAKKRRMRELRGRGARNFTRRSFPSSRTSPKRQLARTVAAGDGCAISAECAARDCTPVPLQRRCARPRRRIPQPRVVVIAARQHEVAMNWVEHASSHRFGVAG